MSLRNLVLFLMFGGLFSGAYYLYHAHTTQPLQADLIAIDTARISLLRIHPKEEPGRVIQLQREDGYWIASNGQVHIRALDQPVQRLLRNLVRITTVDIVAKNEADWFAYGLAPGQAVRIEVFEGDNLTKDFWIGQARQDLQFKDSLAFIRIHQEQEAYAVQGLEVAPFHQRFAVFRPKTIISLPAGMPIDSFSYIFPDTTYTFERIGEQWQLNGLELPDPALVNRYIQNLRNVQANTFVDNFDDNQSADKKYRSLLLYVPQSNKPILISVYLDTLREQPYILHSTQNPGTWFESDSAGIYHRLFWEMDQFNPSLNEE